MPSLLGIRVSDSVLSAPLRPILTCCFLAGHYHFMLFHLVHTTRYYAEWRILLLRFKGPPQPTLCIPLCLHRIQKPLTRYAKALSVFLLSFSYNYRSDLRKPSSELQSRFGSLEVHLCRGKVAFVVNSSLRECCSLRFDS